MEINWEKVIKIDTDWVDRQLNSHFSESKLKVTIRGFTPKANGNLFNCNALIDELGFFILDYVHSEISKQNEHKKLTAKYGEKLADKRLEHSLQDKALVFFGKKHPQTDGKYGELLLFALVESILKCKMVAHKIKALTNPVDQVKGGDGIFLGFYEVEPGVKNTALLIGESKIKQGFSDAVDEAFDSLCRFHLKEVQAEVNEMEFIVANENLFVEDSSDEIDFEEVFNRLTPGTEAYNSQILVHPILIMYNTERINSFEEKAMSREELEQLISDFMQKEKEQFKKKIEGKVVENGSIKKVFLDFFIFPFNDIDNFRNGMYYKIHKAPYPYKESEE